MILGGGDGTFAAHPSTDLVDGSAANPTWAPGMPMNHGRECLNAVLMPNGGVMAIGGDEIDGFSNPPTSPVLKPEIFDKVNGWTIGPTQASPRMYHSTAALLTNGMVLSAGGDSRTWDYEVYKPGYLAMGQTRPVFAGTWASPAFDTIHAGTGYLIEFGPLPVGVSVSRIVLMRPCSTTHHSDMDQRYVELQPAPLPVPYQVPTHDNWIYVKTPVLDGVTPKAGAMTAPEGWYMAFLISSQDTPSLAKWVRFEP